MAQYYSPTQTQVRRAPQMNVSGINQSVSGIQNSLAGMRRDILVRDKMAQQEALDRDKMLATQAWRDKQSAYQAEQAKLTAKNRAAALDIAKNKYDEQVRQNKYLRDIEEGKIIGGDLALNTTTPGKDKVTKQNIETLGYTPLEANKDVEGQKAYMEYLSKNDPNYKKSLIRKYGESAWDSMKTNLTRLPSTLAGVLLEDSSTAGKQRQLLNELENPKKKGLMSKSEFLKSRNTEVQQTNSNLPQLQTEVRTPTTKPASERNLLKQEKQYVDNFTKQYILDNGHKPSRGLLTGVKQEAQKRVRDVLDTQEQADKLKLEQLLKQMNTAQAQAFKLKLAKFKRKPTALDQAKLAESVMKTKKMQKELYDN